MFREFPKTHNLKVLFELTEDEKLTEFYRNNVDLLREIELSYVASRYFDVEYSKNVAEKSLNLAKKFLKVVEVD